MVAARMSLTDSARNTPNTASGRRCGRMKMSGMSRMILRRQASSRLTFACQQSFMALGQAKVSLLLACLRKIILLIPLIFILPHVLPNPVFGVFLAEPVSDILAATITTITFFARFDKILDRGAAKV